MQRKNDVLFVNLRLVIKVKNLNWFLIVSFDNSESYKDNLKVIWC